MGKSLEQREREERNAWRASWRTITDYWTFDGGLCLERHEHRDGAGRAVVQLVLAMPKARAGRTARARLELDTAGALATALDQCRTGRGLAKNPTP